MVCVASPFFGTNECQEIDSIANELERVNGSRRITPEFEFDDSSHHKLLRFEAFYEMFALLLSRKPDATYRPGDETSEATPPTQTTFPSAANVSTTPPPSTNVIDPQYSSTSNATASSKAESTDEHYTHSLANEFVGASYRSLLKSLNSIAWYRDTKYKLLKPCLHSQRSNPAN